MTNNKIEVTGEFEDPFLDDVINEMANTTSGCNSYVFLKSMSFNEYMELLEKDVITIDKSITSGLVSFVYGGGSVLGIELKNDITLQKGEYTLLLDGQYGYGVNEIYGDFG